MAKVVTVEQMRAIEAAADASGLTYDQMMLNAGRAVAETILDRAGEVAGKRVVVLAGKGNNGGDGLVAAKHLAEAGAQVSVYLVQPRPEGDPHLEALRAQEVFIAEGEQDQRWRVLRNLVGTADILVDAVLGTGVRLPLKGKVRDALRAAKAALKERGRRPLVVAVDCPSGLDCDSGALAEEALQADLTVTMAAAKVGLLRFPGAAAVGEIVVADIGIPSQQEELANVDLELATAETVRTWLPERPRDAHKGTFGQVVVVAGSVNLPGAAALAARGAYRVGAGLVTLAVPTPVQPLLAPGLPEVTWLLLPHEMGVLEEGAVEVLEGALGRAKALVLGPGWGTEAATEAFLAAFLGSAERGHRGRIGFLHEAPAGEGRRRSLPPCVVDADGLKLLARLEDWPARLPQGSVLTPHPGEMAILTSAAKEAIQEDRVGAARKWAETWGHVVVLKGAFTVVAAPDGRATVLPFATPALARAGTGDVLAGAIAGLRAQGLDAYEAAVLGGYLHGRAGELVAARHGTTAGVLAGEVAEALPLAIAELEAPQD